MNQKTRNKNTWVIDGGIANKAKIIKANSIKAIANSQRISILKALIKKPTYSADIARNLGISEQLAHHHINILESKGFLRVKKVKKVRGIIARVYEPTATAFVIKLSNKGKALKSFHDIHGLESEDDLDILKKFFKGFIKHNGFDGSFDGYIVVGSPDPHGAHQVRARDGHYAIDLALLLGKIAKTDKFVTMLDVDVIAEKKYGNNLLVIGGPLTNNITESINQELPIQFMLDRFPYHGLISKKTHRKYFEDNIGVIERIRNPYNKKKHILLIAGVRAIGTKAAIVALTKNYKQVLANFDVRNKNDYGVVVQGLDMDGDGKIDDTKILEWC